MTDVNKDASTDVNKGKAEQVKVRGRNIHSTITQIVETYNASNGWAVKKVNNGLMNSLEVYLERNTLQGKDGKVINTESTESTESNEVDDVETQKAQAEAPKEPKPSTEDTSTKVVTPKPKQTARSKSK